ncbi:MAG: 50S ribosomal protein L29 [Elusimicrobia bacterium]|nr:50S ribosomal protein L29 [Elusimicrobiota bacterium]
MKSRNWLEIKSMSPLELSAKLRDSQDKLFRLRFRHSSTPVKNAIEIRDLRRIIAKTKTLMRENEIRSAEQSQSK